MPQTEQGWTQQQENLKAAKAFAAFLDLRAFEIKSFRNDNHDFILLWPLWESIQEQFRKLWDNGFPQDEVLQLLSSNDLPGGGTLTTTTMDEKGKTQSTRQSLAKYQQVLTYKKAVLFLFTDRWRAKLCKGRECGKHFIAEKPGNRYHSSECAAENRDIDRDENWAENKDEFNEHRRREYRALKRGNPKQYRALCNKKKLKERARRKAKRR
jgi:hypothetical protein